MYRYLWFATLLGSAAVAEDENVCVFGDQTFLPGENVGDAFLTKCGPTDSWPCFCNPSLPRQVECPYCGFLTSTGALVCGRDGESTTFQDGSISRQCSCEVEEGAAEGTIKECTVLTAEVGCDWFDQDFNPVFFKNGESFGDLLEGACGTWVDYPSFCYVAPGSAGGDDFVIEYPYCVFDDTESRETVCAKDNETVTYRNEAGANVECSCAYTSGVGADTNCEAENVPTTSPTLTPQPSLSHAPSLAPTKNATKSSSPHRFAITAGLVLNCVITFALVATMVH